MDSQKGFPMPMGTEMVTLKATLKDFRKVKLREIQRHLETDLEKPRGWHLAKQRH